MAGDNPYEQFDQSVSRTLETRLLLLLKVGAKDHLEQLALGKIRFRKLNFYKEEEDKKAAHHDPDEGIDAVLQGDQVRLVITTQDGKKRELSSESGLINVKVYSSGELPVFCMHAIHTGEWTHKPFPESQIPEFKAHLQISDSMKKYGDHIWMITNGTAFNERLIEAVKSVKLGVKGRFVKYVDFNIVHGALSEEHKAFVKNIEYIDEREFRYQLTSPTLLNDPFILDVGDLRDISEIMPFDK